MKQKTMNAILKDLDKPIEEQNIDTVVGMLDIFTHDVHEIAIKLWDMRKEMQINMFDEEKSKHLKTEFREIYNKLYNKFEDFTDYYFELNERDGNVDFDDVTVVVFDRAQRLYNQYWYIIDDDDYYGDGRYLDGTDITVE